MTKLMPLASCISWNEGAGEGHHITVEETVLYCCVCDITKRLSFEKEVIEPRPKLRQLGVMKNQILRRTFPLKGLRKDYN